MFRSRSLTLWFSLALFTGLGAACSDDPNPSTNPAVDMSKADDSLPDMGDSGDEGFPDADEVGLDAAPPVVATQKGVVVGTLDDGVRVFKGIPYAAAPIGDLRFQPPQPAPEWLEPIEATSYGPACPQTPSPFGDVGEQSEDCLSLNVWSHGEGNARPVMVWIHGGGFSLGAANQDIYEGANLARGGDVVVVSINYRLGLLGFLATEALAAESGEDRAGNYGILDQIEALKWVRDNIAEFGGDPENVTIFGESAGGTSVCVLLGSPLAEGLFHRAIIESGGGCYGVTPLRAAQGEESRIVEGESYLGALNCDSATDELACLRAVDTQTLVDALASGPQSMFGLPNVGPGVDGVVITGQTYDLFAQGAVPDVPIITGSNAEEMTLFTFQRSFTKESYEQEVGVFFGALADQVLALYPAADDASAKDAYVALTSDVAFICPALAFASLAAAGDAPGFTYYFDHAASSGLISMFGATHALEIIYAMNNMHVDFFGFSATDTDRALAHTMMTAWSSFARDGAPSMPEGWTSYDPANATIAVFADPTSLVDGIRDGRCSALRQLGLVR